MSGRADVSREVDVLHDALAARQRRIAAARSALARPSHGFRPREFTRARRVHLGVAALVMVGTLAICAYLLPGFTALREKVTELSMQVSEAEEDLSLAVAAARASTVEIGQLRAQLVVFPATTPAASQQGIWKHAGTLETAEARHAAFFARLIAACCHVDEMETAATALDFLNAAVARERPGRRAEETPRGPVEQLRSVALMSCMGTGAYGKLLRYHLLGSTLPRGSTACYRRNAAARSSPPSPR